MTTQADFTDDEWKTVLQGPTSAGMIVITAEKGGTFRETYEIRPDGSHPHVHGANLGVRADAYLRAGGWADLRTAEDHDLWRRLLGSGEPGAGLLGKCQIKIEMALANRS